jgi:hypothetical protein
MTDRRRLGFVTCEEIGITDDDALAARALAGAGVSVEPVPWDASDPRAGFDAFVVRSPWNYHLEPHRFLDWIDRAGRLACVFNDAATIRRNAHKRYLFDIESAGVTIAPTVLVSKGERVDLRAIMEKRNWPQVIVKPAISASSFMTAVVGARDASSHIALKHRFTSEGQRYLDDILESRDALVQPFIQEILTRGERSLIFIDGAFSHCVHKEPFTDKCGGGRDAQADDDELAVAERAMSLLPLTPLYARIDVLRDAQGIDLLMELELIDPELYFRLNPRSAGLFAAALKRRLQARFD